MARLATCAPSFECAGNGIEDIRASDPDEIHNAADHLLAV